MSKESITPPSITDNSFDPEITYKYVQERLEFKGIYLRRDSIFFNCGNVVNLYIAYELDTWLRDLSTDLH